MIFNVKYISNISKFFNIFTSTFEQKWRKKKEYYFSSIIGKFIQIIFKFLNSFIFIIKQEMKKKTISFWKLEIFKKYNILFGVAEF